MNLIEEAWESCRLNNLETLKNIVPKDIKPDFLRINEKNHCHTLLMQSSANGSADCARYLLDKGAPVNQKNFNGFTALHWAGFTGNLDSVGVLLEFNADVEARTGDGKTPIHIAAYRGHRKFIDFMISNGSNLNEVCSLGWNCLHYSILSNQQAMAEFLLRKNIDISQVDSEKKSIKDFAIENKATWILSMLPK